MAHGHSSRPVEPVPGIMARDSQTVITITKHLLHNNHLQNHGDPDVLPIPWNEQVRWREMIIPHWLIINQSESDV